MSNTHYNIGNDFKVSAKTPGPLQTQNPSKKDTKYDTFLLAKYSSVGYYLVTPFLIGVFFGLAIDLYFKTKPLFTLVGIGFGIISAVYSIYKLLKDVER